MTSNLLQFGEIQTFMDLSNIPSFKRGADMIHFHEKLDPGKLDLSLGVMQFENPLDAEGDITYTEGELLLEVRIQGRKRFACTRCLEEFGQEFEKDLELSFEIDEKPVINALPEVVEELLVDSPINILCREDCKGLCAQCGTNRNVKDCGHPSAR